MRIKVKEIYKGILWREIKYFDEQSNSYVLLIGNDAAGFRLSERYFIGDAPTWVRKAVLDYVSQFSDTLTREA